MCLTISKRLMYEPDLEPFEFSPGLENKGRNIFAITFENHTGDNTTLLVGYAVEGGSSSARAIIETVTFTGPQASPYSSGTITVLMDDDESTFRLPLKDYTMPMSMLTSSRQVLHHLTHSTLLTENHKDLKLRLSNTKGISG